MTHCRIIDLAGLAARWGISPARVRAILDRGEFPAPVYARGRVRVWCLDDIERYEPHRIRATLGRPRKETRDGSP